MRAINGLEELLNDFQLTRYVLVSVCQDVCLNDILAKSGSLFSLDGQ